MRHRVESPMFEHRLEQLGPIPTRSGYAIAVILVLASVVELLVVQERSWASLALGVGLAGLFVLRGRMPATATSLGFVGIAASDVISVQLYAIPVTTVVAVSILELLRFAFRWSRARSFPGMTLVIAVSVAMIVRLDGSSLGETVGGVAVLACAALTGVVGRYWGQLRRAQLVQAQQAERVRLAQELHDTVAHHVSAIVIQAQAAQQLLSRSRVGDARSSLAAIESEAVLALKDMRSVVAELRDDTDAGMGIANLADFDDPTGVPRVVVRGIDSTSDLPRHVQRVVYRIGQESITNARRHAVDASRIEVDLSRRDHVVSIVISDDGRPTSSRGDGFGLVGMRERVRELGGQIEAGPTPEGTGWRVSAQLPLQPDSSRSDRLNPA